MKQPRSIELRGASEHNLKHLDADIPLRRLTVVCGVSGSGKTSLALDTLYAEGQRRYIESFSAYTRQFLARIEKPRFERLDHLPPSLAVTRTGRGRNNRSTVGTASELLEPLRILFSLIAELTCYGCGRSLQKHSISTMSEALDGLREGRAMLGFDFEWISKTDLASQLAELQSAGFIRIVIDEEIQDLTQDRSLLAKKVKSKGRGIVIVERFRTGGAWRSASIQASIELVLDLAKQHAIVLVEPTAVASPSAAVRTLQRAPFSELKFSRELRCPACDIEYPESEPRLFSFNSPLGACSQCAGFGEVSALDMTKIIPDRELSLRDGAVAVWRTPAYEHELRELLELASDHELPVDVPVSQLTDSHWQLIQHGVPERQFGGLDGFFAWLERKKYKMHIRAFLSRWKSYSQCSGCEGQRLSREARAYHYFGERFTSLTDMTIKQLRAWIASLESSHASRHPEKEQAVSTATREVRSRLEYLSFVGLDYLTLSRTLHTLSGGEAQRVALTTLLGSDLVDMLYVLDEPTVGLHPSDTEKVAEAIRRLVERGNTVVLIEHEPHLLHQADQVLEIGPGAGVSGGTVCFSGKPSELKKANTLTAQYLFHGKSRATPPRTPGERALELRGACGRNLQHVDLRIPLGCLCVVVGVSGSGKSSLILETLVPAIESNFSGVPTTGLPYSSLMGVDQLRGCQAIDQTPIAKSIRSTPATTTKVMDEIRSVFGSLPDSKQSKLTDSHFSFNSSVGRCPVCEGLGFTVVEMQFMADVQLLCTECLGKRFKPEVLAIRYRDLNVAEVLQLSIEQAQAFFRGQPRLQSKLAPLIDIGLGYLPLGQSVSSLSAGESMRLKLASHLVGDAKQLIVMDEPTTGLHFADIERLIDCVQTLIERGNSVVIIEHNEQLIRRADVIIELGPEAGEGGGRIIAQGPRDAFLLRSDTPTSHYLKTSLPSV
jgi:excinuclease ABC subunit A